MQIINITKKQYILYGLIAILSIMTFLALDMLDEKIRVAVAFGSLFVYDIILEKMLYKDKIVLNFYNSVFDRDVKFSLVENNKNLDFLKIDAKYNEFDDIQEKIDVKKSLQEMLNKHIDTIKSHKNLYVMFASKEEEKLVKNMLKV